jgi:hypothetical protein
MYRKQIAAQFKRIHLPAFIIYLIAAAPFIVFEENIDCSATTTACHIIPSTLPVLMIEIAILGILVILTKTKSVVKSTALYAVFGVVYGATVGVTHYAAIGLSIPILLLLSVYVGLGYSFISIVPLTVLINEPKEHWAK